MINSEGDKIKMEVHDLIISHMSTLELRTIGLQP